MEIEKLVKALRCLSLSHNSRYIKMRQTGKCKGCEYNRDIIGFALFCVAELAAAPAADALTEQQREIDRLRAENARLREELDTYKAALQNWHEPEAPEKGE